MKHTFLVPKIIFWRLKIVDEHQKHLELAHKNNVGQVSGNKQHFFGPKM